MADEKNIEKLLPLNVTVSKNLNTGKISFNCVDGELTEDEKKLFIEDSYKVILKDKRGLNVEYDANTHKRSEIIKEVPTTTRHYQTNQRSHERER